MLRVIYTMLIGLMFWGCNAPNQDSVFVDKAQSTDTVSVVKVIPQSIDTDTLLPEQQQDSPEITDQDTTKNKRKKTAPEPSPMADVASAVHSVERKPPLIQKDIRWTENGVILSFNTTVYPDPEVGCSSSEETFSLRLPIDQPTGEITVNEVVLQNSELTYRYFGGLTGKHNIGPPSSGSVWLKPLENGHWAVKMDLEFMIEDFPMDEQRVERYTLEEVFP